MIKINNVKQWLPIKEFFNNGIIKLKNNNYVKIIKVQPINYELKSEFEKKTILNSYKTFLKNCNFDIQIIIQSNKEDISSNIKIIKEKERLEKNNFIKDIMEKYINYLKKQNKENLSSSKNFYILINEKKSQENEEKIFKELKDKYLKIKEALSRCGNFVCEIESKEEIKNIFKNYFK